MSRTVRPLTKASFSLLGRKIGGLFLIMLASIFSGKAADGASVNKTNEDSVSSKAGVKKSGKTFSGNVSWYGAQFNGKKTACGDIFDMNKKTAAHKTLPFHIKVLVEDPHTGQSVVVVVNDRGPFVKTRVMDLSRGGAVALGTIHKGVCCVDCTVLGNN
jgi:rare lipoprotein A (peptidoglycan hydrolase)